MNRPIKQIYDLVEKDFFVYPLWLFMSEDDEEALDEASVIGGTEEDLSQFMSMYVAFAEFELANGDKKTGYISPEKELSNSQPVMFVSGAAFSLWGGSLEPEPEYLSSLYKMLGLPVKDVFPIKWYCKYVVSDLPNKGIINGYGYYADNGDAVYVVE